MKRKTYKLVLSALFMSIGMVLPLLTGQIPQIGKMLLPMHIPVFLCAFICGWQYGAAVGLLLPILRSFVFGMPILYPNAMGMAVELATYGLVAGLIYAKMKKQTIWAVYGSMLPAMIAGRILWGVAQIILLGIVGNKFTGQMFLAGVFVNSVPGIVLQMVLIPAIVPGLHRKMNQITEGQAA